MGLDDNILEQRIREWKNLQDSLRNEDRDRFKQMMNFAYKYASSIQTMPQYMQDLALILSLVFDQHKIIEWLKKENERLKKKAGLP